MDHVGEVIAGDELGALAEDITCAIKNAAPNAIVGMNHSPWLADDETVVVVGHTGLRDGSKVLASATRVDSYTG